MSKPLPEKTFLKSPRPSGTISQKSKPRHSSVVWNPMQMPFSPHPSLPPWDLFASSCPRTAWLQQWLGGWLWLEAQTSALSPDSQPWHSSQKSPRLSPADFKCRINTTKSPTQTCIWTKILYCSWQRTELNLWVQSCTELSGSQSAQMLRPLWLGNPSFTGQASTVSAGLVGVSRTLWPWIRRSWFLIQASHQPAVGLWTSH